MALPIKPPASVQPGGVFGPKTRKSGLKGSTTPPPKPPSWYTPPVATVTGTKPVRSGGVDVGTVDPKALRLFLKHQGYDIPLTGGMDKVLKSALGDFLNPKNMGSGVLSQALRGVSITGKRDPSAWNQQYGTPHTRLTPNLSPGQTLDNNGNPVPNANGVGPVTMDPIDARGLSKSAASIANTTPISEMLANFGKMIDPKTADAIAGQTYDGQIRDAQLALANDPTFAKQHAADIGSWYGQVLGSQKTAATRDHAATTAGIGSIGDAGKALVASLGGGANMGAGDVAAASQDAVGTQQALQTAEDQYNNDLRPLLVNEKAGMLANQSNVDANQATADRHALENLQGARGQAVTAAQAQIDQENNALAQARAEMGLNIRNANNAMVQQGFNNALALTQAQIAAQMDGLKMITAQQKAGLAHQKMTSPFLATSPTVKNQAFQEAMASLYDPTSGAKLNLTPQQATARVNGVLRGFGFNPAPGTPSGAFGANVVRTWATAG